MILINNKKRLPI